jgi:hypothetical protein
MGVVAMLQNQWPDINFKMSSLNDRRPIDAEDDLIVLATPDPQGLEVRGLPSDCFFVPNHQSHRSARLQLSRWCEHLRWRLCFQDCYRVVNMLGETGPPIVMFNPRLVSGDVGIGLNMRRLQSKFLK